MSASYSVDDFVPSPVVVGWKELELDSNFDEWFAVQKDIGMIRNIKPRMLNDKLPGTIAKDEGDMFNSSISCFNGALSDPFFLCLFPDLDPEEGNIDLCRDLIFATRSTFRRLVRVFITRYLPPSLKRFLSRPEDFTINVERVNSIVILQFGETFTPSTRGYNGGLELALTSRPAKDGRGDESDRIANFYRLRSYQLGDCRLILKNEVDAIDERGRVISIKTKTLPKNPRFVALDRDFFIDLWAQNFFGDIDETKIAVHKDGNIQGGLQSLTTGEIQDKAGIDSTVKRKLLQQIEDFFIWVLRVFDDNKQGIISYKLVENKFSFETKDDYPLPIISPAVRDCVRNLTF
jgi:hypothetical protein